MSTRPSESSSVAPLNVPADLAGVVRLARRRGAGGGGVLRDLPDTVDLRPEFEALEFFEVTSVRLLAAAAGACTLTGEAWPREFATAPVWV
jgi:hypothetical protein